MNLFREFLLREDYSFCLNFSSMQQQWTFNIPEKQFFHGMRWKGEGENIWRGFMKHQDF